MNSVCVRKVIELSTGSNFDDFLFSSIGGWFTQKKIVAHNLSSILLV